uniref:Uncharacterized protein n=1 Tax=Cucumis sativus TaxID=3659 RepID=A0A0A0KEC1_CUCSA
MLTPFSRNQVSSLGNTSLLLLLLLLLLHGLTTTALSSILNFSMLISKFSVGLTFGQPRRDGLIIEFPSRNGSLCFRFCLTSNNPKALASSALVVGGRFRLLTLLEFILSC